MSNTESSEEREKRLLKTDVGQTPQGVTQAMSRSLMTGKDLFADSNEAKKFRDAQGKVEATVAQMEGLNPMTASESRARSPSKDEETGEAYLKVSGEEGKDQGGGVLEFFGLAGGRKRKSKRRRRKSKRNKRMARKRRRSRRAGGPGYHKCTDSKKSNYYCPCPATMMGTNKTCKGARTGAAAYYWNHWIARGDEGKKHKALQHLKRKSPQFKNMSDTELNDLTLKKFIEKFKKSDADKEATEQYFEGEKKKEKAFATLAGQSGIAGDAAFLAQSMGVKSLPGAGKRRKSRRKKRRKSRKKRKSRRRRRRSRRKRR
jgi:hypothetical protein